jgi:hypothetical protein
MMLQYFWCLYEPSVCAGILSLSKILALFDLSKAHRKAVADWSVSDHLSPRQCRYVTSTNCRLGSLVFEFLLSWSTIWVVRLSAARMELLDGGVVRA